MNEVDRYIAQFDGEIRRRLETVREIIVRAAPDAIEKMSYGIVGYKRNGMPLVYFGGFAKHIGFYATPQGHEAFRDELSLYKEGKGSVQFPLTQPLPTELIERMVEFKKLQTEQ